MAAAEAEVTLICMDNSARVADHWGLCDAQIEAIKFYSKTKLKFNPENTVGIYTMAEGEYGLFLSPTNSLKKILTSLDEADIIYNGGTRFSTAIIDACSVLSLSPPHMKKRLLMFVGGPINLGIGHVKPRGMLLKYWGAALDVVNFFSLDIDYASCPFSPIFTSKFHYAKVELEKLVAFVNDNDNSHIVDVADESSVVEILSNSILKDHLHFHEKKAAADVEHAEASRIQVVKPESKNKSAADDKYVQAPGTEYGQRYLAKKTPHIDSKIREDLRRCRTCKQVLPSHSDKYQKKPKENVNFKQVSELSHNNKNSFEPLQNMLDE